MKFLELVTPPIEFHNVIKPLCTGPKSQTRFQNQLVEAAFRKELVYGEDQAERAGPDVVKELFQAVRDSYFRLYLNFMYFDVAKYSYLQFGVVVPYIALVPCISKGGITLGSMQRLVSAFNSVERSFQFLVRNWTEPLALKTEAFVHLHVARNSCSTVLASLRQSHLPRVEDSFQPFRYGQPL